jgi:CHAD domain-containing protein
MGSVCGLNHERGRFIDAAYLGPPLEDRLRRSSSTCLSPRWLLREFDGPSRCPHRRLPSAPFGYLTPMAQRHQYLEREVKLAADLNFVVPDLSEIVGGTMQLPAQDLRTTYFDTPDLRLWERGLTLRHRLGEGGDAGKWTLKLPLEGTRRTLDRAEFSWECGRKQIPDEAITLLHGILRRATLGPVVELESARQRLVIHDTGGSSLGEIDDDIVTVTSGTRKGFTFRQIELEFAVDEAATDQDLLTVDAVLNELKGAGACPDGEQKLSKSLGLGEASKGQLQPTKRSRKFRLADVVQLSIAQGLNQLLINDVRLRLNPLDLPAHAIHQARVATRRLRSDLKTFSTVLNPAWLSRTTTELRWFGNALGQVRDLDVLAERLFGDDRGVSLKEPGQVAITAALDQQRTTAGIELSEILNSIRYLQMLEHLHHDSHAPPFTLNASTTSDKRTPLVIDDAIHVLPSLVRRQWKALYRKVRKAGAHPNAKQLHQIRIASKQLRYAAEAATPVVGKDARRMAKGAERLQTILGEHHDAVSAQDWLGHNVPRDEEGANFAADELTARQQMVQQDMGHKWSKGWTNLNRKKVLRWLG